MKIFFAVFALALASLCASPASAQVYTGTALQNSSGNIARVVPFALVTVCSSSDTAVPCTTKAATSTDATLATPCTLSGASGAPLAGAGCNNPGLADANGNFTFFAASGIYRVCTLAQNYQCVTVPVGGVNVSLGTPCALVYFSTITAMAADPNTCTDGVGDVTFVTIKTNGGGGIGGGSYENLGTPPPLPLAGFIACWQDTTAGRKLCEDSAGKAIGIGPIIKTNGVVNNSLTLGAPTVLDFTTNNTAHSGHTFSVSAASGGAGEQFNFSGTALATCADTSGSGSAQVCTPSPNFTPAAGDCILYTTTTANSGGLTINVGGLGAKSVVKWQATALAANDLLANKQTVMCYDGTSWEMNTIGNPPAGGGSGTVNSGTSGNFSYYATSTTAVSDSGVPLAGAGTYVIAGPGGSSASSTLTLNRTSIWSFIPTVTKTVANVAYAISVADNTADLYDIGFYNASGSTLCHTGATAGTTFAPSANQFSLALTGTCTLTANTLYFAAITGNAITAKPSALNAISLYTFVQPSANSTTSGGVLNSTITPPSATAGAGNIPSVVFY